MKIVVIGGTGLIGSKVVARLTEHGHEAVPASPRLGINTITGEGLAAALDGASVVVDVSNSPNFEHRDGTRLLRDLDPAPSDRRGGRCGSATTSRCRSSERRTLSESGDLDEDDRRVLPGEARPGSADRSVRDPVLDRPRHPVLRVHQEHRRRVHRSTAWSVCRRSCSSRWRPTMLQRRLAGPPQATP